MNISDQLRTVIKQEGLTLFGAAHLIAAELDSEEPIKTIHQRLRRMTSDRPPQSIQQLEEILAALGYEVQIIAKR